MLYHFEDDLFKLYKHQGMFIAISFLLWLLFCFLATLCGMWDLNSLTRD